MTVGDRLRQAREDRGLALDVVAARTNISPRILRAIERDDFATVPPGIFVRGYLRAYASAVRLDPEEIVGLFRQQHEPASPEPVSPAPAERAEPFPRLFSRVEVRDYALIAIAVLAVAGVMTQWWSRQTGPNKVTPAVPQTAQSENVSESAARPQPTGPANEANALASRAVDGPVPATSPGTRPPLALALTATRDVWVSVDADGQRVVYRILKPEETVTVSASNSVKLRVGDAGALLVSLGESSAVPAGSPGAVRDMRIERRADGTLLRVGI